MRNELSGRAGTVVLQRTTTFAYQNILSVFDVAMEKTGWQFM